MAHALTKNKLREMFSSSNVTYLWNWINKIDKIVPVRNATITASVAEINAGKVIIPAVAGMTITPLRYFIKSVGDFSGGTGTNLVIQDTNGTPVVVVTVGKSALTSGAKITSNVVIPTVVDGAGFMASLTKGYGLSVTGDTLSAGTSVTISIDYTIV